MGYRVIAPDEQEWITRPHADGEPARHVTELSELAVMEHVRANVWRYEPGVSGKRHPVQDETFVVLAGAACARLPALALADGFAYVSTTRVNGATALRLCTINPRTTREDVENTLDRLAALAEQL